jgi:hypothetical protein
LVKLSGVVDADANLEGVIAQTGTLVLDVDGIARITSFGVREWMRAIRATVASEVYIVKARAARLRARRLDRAVGAGRRLARTVRFDRRRLLARGLLCLLRDPTLDQLALPVELRHRRLSSA